MEDVGRRNPPEKISTSVGGKGGIVTGRRREIDMINEQGTNPNGLDL